RAVYKSLWLPGFPSVDGRLSAKAKARWCHHARRIFRRAFHSKGASLAVARLRPVIHFLAEVRMMPVMPRQTLAVRTPERVGGGIVDKGVRPKGRINSPSRQTAFEAHRLRSQRPDKIHFLLIHLYDRGMGGVFSVRDHLFWFFTQSLFDSLDSSWQLPGIDRRLAHRSIDD